VLDHGFYGSEVRGDIDDGPISNRSRQRKLLVNPRSVRTEDGNPVAKIRAESSDVARQLLDVFPDREPLGSRERFRRDVGLSEKVFDSRGKIPQEHWSRLEIHVDRQHWESPRVGPPESIDLSLIQHLDLLRVDDTEATPATTGRIEARCSISDIRTVDSRRA
jgi:hypothetical protein